MRQKLRIFFASFSQAGSLVVQLRVETHYAARRPVTGSQHRRGNGHSAEDWDEMLLPEIERQQELGKEVVFRADAAFAKPEIYEELEERGVKYAIRLPANAGLEQDIEELLTRPGGAAPSQTHRVVQGLSLPSRQLEDRTTSSGEGGVPCRGALPAVGFHRDQPGDSEPGGGAVLQQAGDSGAVDQGRQASRKDDSPLLSSFPLEPSAAGTAPTNRELVADESAAAAGEDTRTASKTCPLLLVTLGRRTSEPATVWGDARPDRATADTDGIDGWRPSQ